MTITAFEGDYHFLSNFYPSPIEWQGALYPTVEHAFQAAKVIDPAQRLPFTGGGPDAAKDLGNLVPLRADWDEVRVPVMAELSALKYEIPALRRRLVATAPRTLINGNWWGDRFWGVVRGEGRNELGQILMALRARLSVSVAP